MFCEVRRNRAIGEPLRCYLRAITAIGSTPVCPQCCRSFLDLSVRSVVEAMAVDCDRQSVEHGDLPHLVYLMTEIRRRLEGATFAKMQQNEQK